MTTTMFWMALGAVLLLSLATGTVWRFHHLNDYDWKHAVD